ncbi:hypothetical protein MNBD_ALPHA01-331 [hydrothermal vent metagenome]|uniref:Uncharacterized protein n=1 Tax=hydrothermal vent metagenome TaxID=652676 RepID=A0A3B0RCZ2_9ZZZZ
MRPECRITLAQNEPFSLEMGTERKNVVPD